VSKITRRQFLKGGAAALSLTGLGLSGCKMPASSPAPIEEVSLRLLWTGDAHGHLRPIYHREYYDESFLTANGIKKGSAEAYLCASPDFLELAGKYGKVGGYANLATLIQQQRSAYPEKTLLLEAGDAWYGSAIALLTEGRACVEVMNAIGYDAMTMHWEFNLGKEVLFERIAEAQFPVLAQNLVDTDFEDRVLEASIVKEFGDVKVAVVGQAYPFSMLTTEDREANPGLRMGYRDDMLQEEVDRLRGEEGVDIVVLLSHMGYDQDQVMAGVLTGIDVIVGGHTHDILWQPEQIGETLLLQGGSHGKFLGQLDLEIRDGKIAGFEHQLLPVLAEQVEPDGGIKDLIDSLYRPFEDQLSEVIGETESLLYRRSLFGGTTDDFLTRAYRDLADAELGCSSGWRFGTTLLPGPIRVEDVYNVMKPTASPLYKVKLSGGTIRRIIEDNLDNVFNPDPLQKLGGDVTRCNGIKAGLRRSAPREERTVDMFVNGEAMEPARIYTMGTSGGRTQYLDPEAAPTPMPAVEALIDYIRDQATAISANPVHVFDDVEVTSQ